MNADIALHPHIFGRPYSIWLQIKFARINTFFINYIVGLYRFRCIKTPGCGTNCYTDDKNNFAYMSDFPALSKSIVSKLTKKAAAHRLAGRLFYII